MSGSDILSVEEVLPAVSRLTKALLWAVPVATLDFGSLFVRDDASIVLVLVVEGELRPSRDLFQGEERQIVDVRVRVVVGHREQATIRITAMIHEACRTANVFTVTHVEVRDIFRIQPHVFTVLLEYGPVAFRDFLGVPVHLVRIGLEEVGFCDSLWLHELVKRHMVIGLVSGTLGTTLVGYFDGNDFPSVRIDEIPFPQGDRAAKACSAY